MTTKLWSRGSRSIYRSLRLSSLFCAAAFLTVTTSPAFAENITNDATGDSASASFSIVFWSLTVLALVGLMLFCDTDEEGHLTLGHADHDQAHDKD